jgi:hypothetical protein
MLENADGAIKMDNPEKPATLVTQDTSFTGIEITRIQEVNDHISKVTKQYIIKRTSK